jgi:hypothetical protein
MADDNDEASAENTSLLGRALRTAVDSAPPALPISAAIQKAKSAFGLAPGPGGDNTNFPAKGSD